MAALLMSGSTQLSCRHSCFSGRQLCVRPMPRVAQTFSTLTQAAKIGPGKNWEHTPCHPDTGKWLRQKMPIHTGDTVQVIAGNDKGKVATVTKVVPKFGTIVVEGVNIKTKHNKPVREGEPGNISERESPIHHSNVMLYSTEKKVRSRVGYRTDANGNKVRFLKKTGEELPSRPPTKSEE